jgi:integrase
VFFQKPLKYYAENLFAAGGYWHKKRQAKGRGYIRKVLLDKNALVRNHIIPLWGNLPPQKLTTKNIDEKLFSLPIGDTTKNKIISCFSEIFTHLIEEGICRDNPAKNIVRFCGRGSSRGVLSPEEMQRLFPENHAKLLKIWRQQMYLTALLVLKDTGLRPGELRALQWQDWHLDLRFFPITKAIEANTRLSIKSTKTGLTKPAIVSKFTAGEIERLKFSTPQAGPEDFIFVCESGLPVSDTRLSVIFRKGVKRAGLERPDLTPYWLRHTFNTRTLEKYPDEIVRRLMGHASPQMTRYYRHADTRSLRKEAEKITRIMEGKAEAETFAADRFIDASERYFSGRKYS